MTLHWVPHDVTALAVFLFHPTAFMCRNKAVENGWVQPGVLLTFRFDGENVSGDETTTSLDLEDEDVIDVAF